MTPDERRQWLAYRNVKNSYNAAMRISNEVLLKAALKDPPAVAVTQPDVPPLTALAQTQTSDPQPASVTLTKATALPLSCERAYRGFQRAVSLCGEMTDKAAYDWLNEQDKETDEMPAFDTWVRYLRKGREHYGTQKNTPRGGRSGRSIVTLDQIEYQSKKERDED
jgi:hypothetical protein